MNEEVQTTALVKVEPPKPPPPVVMGFAYEIGVPPDVLAAWWSKS